MTTPENATLADFTSTALIIPNLHTTRSAEVMQELNDVLRNENPTISEHLFRNLSVLNHELLTGLFLDFGAVFPKVIVPQLQQPRFALGRSTEPLPWRAKWLPPLRLIFLVLGPSAVDAAYQQLVAALSRLEKNAIRLESLRNASGAEEMLALLEYLPIKANTKPGAVPTGSAVR